MKKNQRILKIIISYAIFSLTWLMITNSAVGHISTDMEMMLRLEKYTGYFYIILSTSFLYFLISNMEVRYVNIIRSIKGKNTVLMKELENINNMLEYSEHKSKKLEEYANIDELTGLYSRRRGLELIKEEMQQEMEGEAAMLIAFIDVDNIKMVNDSFGHIEGDVLLKSIAGIIKDALARTDIVCRYGGDEFLAALPGASEKDAQGIKSRIEDAVLKYNSRSMKSYSISVSVGFSEFNRKKHRSLEEAIKEADERMYITKRFNKLSIVSNFR
jgi:diguanylate cyclase (GGDEF)-like protein